MKKIIAKPKIIIGAGKANKESKPPLTPLLSPYNIKLDHFINQFNEKTSSITDGIDVVAYIHKYSRMTYELVIKPTPISKLILNGGVDERNVITAERLYDIVKVRQLFARYFYKKEIDEKEFVLLARSVLGVMRSFHNIKINPDFYSNYDLQSTNK